MLLIDFLYERTVCFVYFYELEVWPLTDSVVKRFEFQALCLLSSGKVVLRNHVFFLVDLRIATFMSSHPIAIYRTELV